MSSRPSRWTPATSPSACFSASALRVPRYLLPPGMARALGRRHFQPLPEARQRASRGRHNAASRSVMDPLPRTSLQCLRCQDASSSPTRPPCVNEHTFELLLQHLWRVLPEDLSRLPALHALRALRLAPLAGPHGLASPRTSSRPPSAPTPPSSSTQAPATSPSLRTSRGRVGREHPHRRMALPMPHMPSRSSPTSRTSTSSQNEAPRPHRLARPPPDEGLPALRPQHERHDQLIGFPGRAVACAFRLSRANAAVPSSLALLRLSGVSPSSAHSRFPQSSLSLSPEGLSRRRRLVYHTSASVIPGPSVSMIAAYSSSSSTPSSTYSHTRRRAPRRRHHVVVPSLHQQKLHPRISPPPRWLGAIASFVYDLPLASSTCTCPSRRYSRT